MARKLTVIELAEHDFLHCTTCDDYDLCQTCFGKDAHGHHPKHAFEPAVGGTKMPEHIRVRMAAGRNQVHHAICDGCDKVSENYVLQPIYLHPLTQVLVYHRSSPQMSGLP